MTKKSVLPTDAVDVGLRLSQLEMDYGEAMDRIHGMRRALAERDEARALVSQLTAALKAAKGKLRGAEMRLATAVGREKRKEDVK